MTDTRGLSRHEHLVAKIEDTSDLFTPEEMDWAIELLSDREWDAYWATDRPFPWTDRGGWPDSPNSHSETRP